MQRILSAAVGLLIAVSTPEAAAQERREAPTPRGAISARPSPLATASLPADDSARHLLPGTRADVFATIQGNALTSTSNPLPNALMRLRDTRHGRILGTRVTDVSGMFTFSTLDPGNYIVELLGHDQSILAVSEMVNPGPGDVISVLVKLPWQKPAASGMLGVRPAIASVLAVAAASGVLGRTATGQPISPR